LPFMVVTAVIHARFIPRLSTRSAPEGGGIDQMGCRAVKKWRHSS
jgi:hypothetical protein